MWLSRWLDGARATGGDDDQLFGERVRQGGGQQRAKSVGEEIGALSTMKVKRH